MDPLAAFALVDQPLARLVGRLSEEMALGVEPVFATIEIPSDAGLVVTPPRWIDNERAIENAARDRHVDPNHEVFSGRGFGGASVQRIMEAIYAISSSLLNFETPDLSSLPKERTTSAVSRGSPCENWRLRTGQTRQAKIRFGVGAGGGASDSPGLLFGRLNSGNL